MPAAEVTIDDVRLVIERVFFVERKKLVSNIDVGVVSRGDRLQQIHSAVEMLVEDGAGQVVSTLRIAIQKEAAAELVVRFVDRDVGTRYASVPDEQGRRRQSGKSTADHMRLHPPLPSATANSALAVARQLERQRIDSTQTLRGSRAGNS